MRSIQIMLTGKFHMALVPQCHCSKLIFFSHVCNLMLTCMVYLFPAIQSQFFLDYFELQQYEYVYLFTCVFFFLCSYILPFKGDNYLFLTCSFCAQTLLTYRCFRYDKVYKNSGPFKRHHVWVFVLDNQYNQNALSVPSLCI